MSVQQTDNGGLDEELLQQMREDFFEESEELLDQLNLSLSKLEGEPDHPDLINEIFRAVHTLKGSAGFLSLDKIGQLAHRMEDVFDRIRKGELKATSAVVDAMYDGLMTLHTLRDRALQGTDDADVNLSWILSKLDQIVQGEAVEEPSPPAQKPVRAEPEPSAAPPAPKTVRVRMDRLDALVDLLSEWIPLRNVLTQYAEGQKDPALTEAVTHLHRLTRQLQRGIMSLRMEPIQRLFNRFPGVVRNLAREHGKAVELITEGGDTELDRAMIEQIHDPLVHLFRNAVDHGIEPPDERRAAGKPERGRLVVSAAREGDRVIIRVEDDGRGIHPEHIRVAALKRGLLSQEEASRLSPQETVELIFTPGFSTAEVVTDTSGRGVGMDVVKKHVEVLRGDVHVETRIGEGTVFSLRFPLTLATVDVLLARADGLRCAIPIYEVEQILWYSISEIRRIQNQAVIFVDDRPLPLRDLRAFLGWETQTPPSEGRVPVLLLSFMGKRIGLRVEDLLGRQEVVLKPLGAYLGHVQGIEGAAVLADGTVAPILDVHAVLASTGNVPKSGKSQKSKVKSQK